MRFDVVTIFPEFFASPLDWGVMRRARAAGIVSTEIHDLRSWTHDRHCTVDDRPFGGGEGMVLKPEPIFEAVESLQDRSGSAPHAGTAVVLLSASGKSFRQDDAASFSRLPHIILLCGRYEGVDERVAEHLADYEVSVGDFVLSGGELPAAIIMDAVTRLLPGALGNEDSSRNESFAPITGDFPVSQQIGGRVTADARSLVGAPSKTSGILDFPHYTRPQSFRGWDVPPVLVGGDHAQVRRWRRKAAIAKTLRNRPDLIAGAAWSAEDALLLDALIAEMPQPKPASS